MITDNIKDIYNFGFPIYEPLTNIFIENSLDTYTS